MVETPMKIPFGIKRKWHNKMVSLCLGGERPAKMIANCIDKRPPAALAKRRGDKNQPLPAIGAKASIETKPPT